MRNRTNFLLLRFRTKTVNRIRSVREHNTFFLLRKVLYNSHKRSCISKQIMKVKKVKNAIIFATQSCHSGCCTERQIRKYEVLQYYFLRNLKKYFKNCRSATSLANVRELHDHVSSQKSSIVQGFLKQERLVCSLSFEERAYATVTE